MTYVGLQILPKMNKKKARAEFSVRFLWRIEGKKYILRLMIVTKQRITAMGLHVFSLRPGR